MMSRICTIKINDREVAHITNDDETEVVEQLSYILRTAAISIFSGVSKLGGYYSHIAI